MIYKKTITLFETAFVFGYLFGGGHSDSELQEIQKAAHHFGRAFQIADDINDYEEDLSRECVLNYATLVGREKALEEVERELFSFEKVLESLKLFTPAFKEFKSLILGSTQVPL